MLKTVLASLAALLLLAVIAGAIVVGARSITIPISQERYQSCLDHAEQSHEPYKDCPRYETLWDRGFEDPIAYYTFWLALFTVALAVGGLAQGILLGRQIGLARDEFISSHRPRLRMRLLSIEDPEQSQPFKIQFDLANIGDTAAQIVDIDLTLRLQGIPIPATSTKGATYEDQIARDRLSGGEKIAAGDSATIKHTMSLKFDPAWGQPFYGRGAERIVVVGVIRYQDDRNIKRRTAFYRFCTDNFNRFRFGDWDEATKRDREYED